MGQKSRHEIFTSFKVHNSDKRLISLFPSFRLTCIQSCSIPTQPLPECFDSLSPHPLLNKLDSWFILVATALQRNSLIFNMNANVHVPEHHRPHLGWLPILVIWASERQRKLRTSRKPTAVLLASRCVSTNSPCRPSRLPG